jgi:hypothetical protein
MKNKVLIWVVLAWVAMNVALPSYSEEIVLPRKGEYKNIDVKLQNDAIDTLIRGSQKDKEYTTNLIMTSPEKYAPPVFYVLSSVLFHENKKDEAAFWFYAGQLRGRFDANRCADISAREAIAVLNQKYGPEINQYTFQDLPKLKALVPKVVEWDKKTPHKYDHRWINLHGMDAVNASLDNSEGKRDVMSLPKDEWDKIAEKTRANYLSSFNEMMEQLLSSKK